MVTLDRLVNVLGGYGVRLRSCSVSRATELSSVVLPEATAERAVVTGDVLLAVGAESVEQAVGWAGSARAVVVLVRGVDEQFGFAETGDAVAVLMVDPAVAWSELAAVVYGLVLEGRETESGRGPTDLFALADSVADTVGGPVTIEDRLSRVLAYSRGQQHADPARVETILSRQAPQYLRALLEQRGVFAHLADSGEPLFVPGDSEHGLSGRMVAAARTGRRLLGSVWVATPTPLEGARLAALTDGAHTVALHLLRSRASADLERQVESELVIRLLEGAADSATAASRLGLPPEGLRVIAVHARVGADRDAALMLLFERATTGFGWSRPGRSALSGNAVYTVLPAREAETARRWVSALRSALPEQACVSAGISAVASATELASALPEADECLALHEIRSSSGPAPAYDEAWQDILLQRLRTAAKSGRTPARGPVADLRRHDSAHGTRYVATLRAWLETMGDLARAGERLGVHENTVRYRLRKMADVTTLDLEDSRMRVATMIELAAADTD
ncbi:PucR family transcriptional regulator [Nocardia bhagyanarayanae]|uniref:DNA-binding PucR family transcriptional regulator n=1 Tax=Nocardia bhagyanarayanae TaxID=1215925 RepID=A0A543FI03_9NOCA|nr:helix-turn-helix domain-containing protein [Nocardia bhagyanarayanae]TQM33488.1 DNA-binding PucR family transcriptional regulator [Nocardia bhagyanarayanae]